MHVSGGKPLFRLSQLSFAARLAINAGLVLAISGVLLLYASIRHEAQYVRAEMARQLEREVEALLVTLSEPVVIGDYATIEQVIRAQLVRSHMSTISWRDVNGNSLTADKAEAASHVPEWFTRWIDIPAQHTMRELEIGGRQYGTVTVESSPAGQIRRLWWNTFLVHLAILALAIGLDFLGILYILRRGLRPLTVLAAGARRIGSGALTTRIPVHGAPELRRTIKAFNQMVDKVQTQSDHLNAIFKAASDFAIIAVDLQGTITLFNYGAEQMLGYRGSDIVGERTLETLFSQDELEYLANDVKVQSHSLILLMSGVGRERDWGLQRRDGSRFLASVAVTAISDSNGATNGYLLIAQDVTERRADERQLRIAAAAFETQEGMMVTDVKGIILRVNSAFAPLTGYQPDEVVGKSINLLKSVKHTAGFYKGIWRSLFTHHHWQGEVWTRRKNGELFPEWLSVSAVMADEKTISHFVASFTDLSERKQAEERIEYLAFYDPMTQLPNRRLLNDRLGLAIATSGRTHHWGGVVFIDLDHFKTINDSMGHEVGDLLLVEIARRIQKRVREEDTVARLGGDEFVVILGHLHEERTAAATYAEHVANDIAQEVNKVCTIKGFNHYTTASIGVTLFKGESDLPGEILKHAEIAMYQAKSAGRGTIKFFDPDMQTLLDARLVMENELRQAISGEQLELYYQIQVDNSDSVIGAEALLRWHHPQRGMVSPNLFIPLAEESGLIVPIGHWVIETACQRLKAWEGDPLFGRIQLAVNVSARQFRHDDFVEQVLAVIEHTAIQPERLKLELTESVVLDDIDDSIDKMRRLKAHGICLSIDDFGTGHSSLSYLRQLPLDQMKIDQSFVRDIADDTNDEVLVKTIIAMGRSLGLEVIAEGVETLKQRLYLEQHGCYAFQGYLFGRPLPLSKFERQLTEGIAVGA